MDLDPSGNPHTSFYNDTELGLGYAVRSGDTWSSEIVDEPMLGDTGSGLGCPNSIGVDSSGNPHISYYDTMHENLVYATKYGGNWDYENVDSAGVSELPLVDSPSSIALDSLDNPHISYFYNLDYELRYWKILSPPTDDPPTADPDGPYNGLVGQPVLFDGSASYDPDGFIISYEWNFNNSVICYTIGPLCEFITDVPDTYIVTLTVTDNDGLTDTDTTTVTITQPPTQIYSVVRGENNRIYYNIFEDSAWTGWSAVPGSTPNTPAATFCGGELHIAVRSMGGGIYYGNVTLSTGTFNGWTRVPGVTPSAPDLAADSACNVYLAVQGSSGGIYLNTLSSGSWSGWQKIPGSTSDSPAVTVQDSILHFVVRGGGSSIWHGQQNLTDSGWSGWSQVPGTTPSRPDLAADTTGIYLAVHGSNNRVYVNKWKASSWQGWAGPPTGSTQDAPAVTELNGQLYVMVRSESGGLWLCSLDISSSTWLSWIWVGGSTLSPPTITSYLQ
jgi:hypothetical protein